MKALKILLISLVCILPFLIIGSIYCKAYFEVKSKDTKIYHSCLKGQVDRVYNPYRTKSSNMTAQDFINYYESRYKN